MIRKNIRSFIRFLMVIFRKKKKENLKLSDIRHLLNVQATNEKISSLIESNVAFMVGRFGSVELDALIKYERCMSLGRGGRFFERLKYGAYPFTTDYFFKLNNNAGVYPINRSTLDDFYTEMLSAMSQVDILASWVSGEAQFEKKLDGALICPLKAIEPYYSSNPWTAKLAGKRVLVIHPFAKTIKQQYEKNREYLFQDSQILPVFELLCIEAVQSIAGNKPDHENWLAALQWMTDEAMKLDFDVAIIGCGAYGFPLSARLKHFDKKVIHLGGATQILFGIKGNRWDHHPVISNLYNEYWCYPSKHEQPSNSKNVENGCYW